MGHIDLDSGAINEDLRLDLDAPRLAFLPRDPADSGPRPSERLRRALGRVLGGHRGEAQGRGNLGARSRSPRFKAASRRCSTMTSSRPALTKSADMPLMPSATSARSRSVTLNRFSSRFGRAANCLPACRGEPARPQHRPGPSPCGSFRSRAYRSTAESPMPYGVGRADVGVEVSERLAIPGVEWRPVTLCGRIRMARSRTPPPGESPVRYVSSTSGLRRTRAAAAEVVLRVRAGTTLKPSRRTLHNGATVVLRGRLLGRPDPVYRKARDGSSLDLTRLAHVRQRSGTSEGREVELPLHVHRHDVHGAISLPGGRAAGGVVPIRHRHVAGQGRARESVWLVERLREGAEPPHLT